MIMTKMLRRHFQVEIGQVFLQETPDVVWLMLLKMTDATLVVLPEGMTMILVPKAEGMLVEEVNTMMMKTMVIPTMMALVLGIGAVPPENHLEDTGLVMATGMEVTLLLMTMITGVVEA